METRKVLTIGKSSYAVTLPRSFVEEHGLEPGDNMHVSHQANQLVVLPHETSIRTEVDLSRVTQPNQIFFWGLMRGLFLQGAQHVTLTNVNQETREFLQHELEKPDTNFYVHHENGDEMHLHCPLEVIPEQALENLIKHSLQHIYKVLTHEEDRPEEQVRQLNLSRRALSQHVKSRTHLALYSFIEKLELLLAEATRIQASPGWIEDYAHAVYLLQRACETKSLTDVNKLCSQLQELTEELEQLNQEAREHAKSLLRYLKHANGNLLIVNA